MKAPELLSPAGTLKMMRYSLAYGADAVYAGQPRYSLRVRNNDFTLENLAQGIEEAHALGKRFFVASNISPHNRKIATYLKDIEPVIEMQPDALIMTDPGLIMMVREKWPEQEIHLSVQANTVNYMAVKFWQSVGIKRVILSRELSLEEVEEIRQQCPDIELEVFVHGALCIAYSGRCLLSGYFNHRDPNQGTCTNACRWDYKVQPAQENELGDIVLAAKQNSPDQHAVEVQQWSPEQAGQPALGVGKPSDQIMMIEEGERPGEYMPMFEDEHGTYILNSKDLRAVQHVARLAKIGVDCLKIEGRTKSHYYAARTTQVYRKAIDDAVQGKDFDMELMNVLEGLAHRGYTEGFYRRHVHDEFQNYLTGNSDHYQQKFVGEILSYDSDKGLIEVDVKNRFDLGDRLELMTPSGNYRFELKQMLDKKGHYTEAAPGSGHVVYIPVETSGDLSNALLMRDV